MTYISCSVPLGTYEKEKKVYMTLTDDDRLIIRERIDGPIIADHQIHHEKGQLIQATQHTRDRTKGIDAYITTIAKQFEDVELAYTFLQEIRKAYPRYIRDQLQIVSKAIKDMDSKTLNQALQESMKRKLFSASEFSDVVSYVKRQRQVDTEQSLKPKIKPLYQVESVLDTKPAIRDITGYVSILKGESL